MHVFDYSFFLINILFQCESFDYVFSSALLFALPVMQAFLVLQEWRQTSHMNRDLCLKDVLALMDFSAALT